MPKFKKGGTAYTEHPAGSDAFKSDKAAENRAVHGGKTPPGFDTECEHGRPNPDPKGGPQAY